MAVTISGTTGLSNVPAGNIAATNVQDAVNELDAEKSLLAGSSSQLFSAAAATGAANVIRLDQQQVPFRNRIINGDMQVSQVNGAAAVTPTVNGYYHDQWRFRSNPQSKLSLQQVIDAPVGFKYSLKVAVVSQYAPAAGEYFQIAQPIEGQNLIDFQFGTAGAQTIACSLWVKGSVAGTYSCFISNASQNRSYVGTIAVTSSWVKQTIILIADTTGTWPTDNTEGLQFGIDLGSGSGFSNTAGVWLAANSSRTSGSVTFVNQTVGSTLNITGVQLEKVPAGATVGTDFEFIPYCEQLRRCQRYYYSRFIYIPRPLNGFQIYQLWHPSTMRIAPTISLFDAIGTSGKVSSHDGTVNTNNLPYWSASGDTITFNTNNPANAGSVNINFTAYMNAQL